uniref:Uncharacterized protein n=1 Tax=Arundo donax TaxID=35708 RepID=A0A0A8YDU4_ARUDO
MLWYMSPRVGMSLIIRGWWCENRGSEIEQLQKIES